MVLRLALLLVLPFVAASSQRPHIILIVADDLGYNDVQFHGSDQIPTPNLNKLAGEGVTLANYYVQPVCSPTRSTVLTGRHVIHTGIYDPDCDPGTTNSVPLNVSMLPEHLASLDYESHAVGKWHLGSFSRRAVPTGKGFDTFLGYYSGAEDYFTHEDNGANDMHDDKGDVLEPLLSNKGEYSTHIYTKRATDIIEGFSQREDGAKHLFMYLAFQAIHSPDEVPSWYSDRFNKTIPDTPGGVGQHRRTVAGMVACLDEAVGNVTKALREAGMEDDTLIVFTTDNGGPAQNFNDNMASNWPLRGMKRTLWQGGVRGVGFATGAGIATKGTISNGLMHVADWFPSLLTAAAQGLGPSQNISADWRDVVGRDAVSDWQLGDGEDVWKMIAHGDASPRSEVLLEAHPDKRGGDDGNGQGIIVGDLKLILEKGPNWSTRGKESNDGWYDSGSNPQRYKHVVVCEQPPPVKPDDFEMPLLFNITADPCEYHDLKKSRPDDVERLKARLALYQATAVPVTHHELPVCQHPIVPLGKPVNGSWMPVCP